MIQLPEALENRFFEAIKIVEEEMKMPYINVIEQYGIRQGRREAEKDFEQVRLQAAQDQHEKTKSIVRGMFSVEGLNDERIAEITGLALEEVTELRLASKH